MAFQSIQRIHLRRRGTRIGCAFGPARLTPCWERGGRSCLRIFDDAMIHAMVHGGRRASGPIWPDQTHNQFSHRPLGRRLAEQRDRIQASKDCWTSETVKGRARQPGAYVAPVPRATRNMNCGNAAGQEVRSFPYVFIRISSKLSPS